MNNPAYRNYFFVSVIAILLTGCNKPSVEKSQELSDAESFLQKTNKDISVIQFAEMELIIAGNMLKAATQAETKEQMSTLVYLANNKINTAIKTSQLKLYQRRIADVNTLRANHLKLKGNAERKPKSK